MATVIRNGQSIRRIRNDYPSWGDTGQFRSGYSSSQLDAGFVYFEPIYDATLNGETIDSAVLILPRIAGGYSYTQTLEITLRDDNVAFDSITWNYQPTLLGAGEKNPTDWGNTAGDRYFDVTSLIQWIVDNHSDCRVVRVGRNTNTKTGSYDLKVFGTTASDYRIAITHSSAVAAPDAPTGVVARWAAANTVDVSWQNTSTGGAYTSVTVQRSSGGAYANLAAGTGLAPGTTAFTDSTATDGTTYTYKIVATNGTGSATSAASNSVGTAYVVTFTNVPSGCSVKVVKGAASEFANRTTSSTVYLDCCLLADNFDSATVYSLPDAAGAALCQLTSGIGYADTLDVGGLGADSLHLMAVTLPAGTPSSAIDITPSTVAIASDGTFIAHADTAAEVHAATDVAVSGDTKATITGHTASLTLDLTAAVKTAVFDATLSATNFESAVHTDWTGFAVTASVSMTATNESITHSNWVKIGPLFFFDIRFTVDIGGTLSFGLYLVMPVSAPSVAILTGSTGLALADSTTGSWIGDGTNANVIVITKYGSGNYTSGTKAIRASGFYRWA
jgi:hypothetical protein